jgi:hypothetical protein
VLVIQWLKSLVAKSKLRFIFIRAMYPLVI